MSRRTGTRKRVTAYLVARSQGESKLQAKKLAGYSPKTVTSKIENTPEYQELAPKFRDALLEHIDMKEIAEHLVDNIRQEGEKRVDRGARNKALELAMNRIEPEAQTGESEDQVMIVMAKRS